MVYFEDDTAKAVWKYLTTRPDSSGTEPLLVNREGKAFHENRIGKLLRNMAKRAGVYNVGPHRIRHTFAINYLRNGGNIRFLQRLLGHSTINMSLRYLAVAEQDLSASHRVASPVANMALR